MFQEVVRNVGIGQAGGGLILNRLPSRSNTMHANAILTPLMRAKLVAQHTASGASLRATAAGFDVSEKTVRRWLQRARSLGFPTRLHDRSSTPHQQPRRTASALENQILELRRQRRTYAQIRTVLPQVSLATLSRILRRHGLQRLANLEPPKPPPIRYEHPHPGDLLHLDIKKLGRFARPGVRATGDRTQRNPGAGVESLHVAIDDHCCSGSLQSALRAKRIRFRVTHSRLGFACLLPDERTPSVLAALRQAVAFYHDHAINIRRVLTDRGSTYRSKLFAQTCRELGLKHSFTPPYRPQTNGKAERFIQTLAREWAYARSYDSSQECATYLTPFLHDSNFHRPHAALHHQPPSSRLPKTADNVLRYDS